MAYIKSVLHVYIKMDVHMEKILFLLPKELTYIIFFLCFPLSSEPVQWTTIPVLVKIYKLLINKLSNQINMRQTCVWKEDEEEEEEDWEDEDVDEKEDIQLRGQTLSDLIDSMAAEFNGECMLSWLWTEHI